MRIAAAHHAAAILEDLYVSNFVALIKICEFRDRYGEDYWKPAPLLKQLAEEGSSFAAWDKNRSAE